MATSRVVVTWLVLLVFNMFVPAASLVCYSCYDCKTFEAVSQSKECGPEENHCIKKITLTGDVNRLCATEEQCNSGTLDRNALNSTCCAVDRCNSATKFGGTLHQSATMSIVALAIMARTWD